MNHLDNDKEELTIDLTYQERRHWFKVYIYKTEEQYKEALKAELDFETIEEAGEDSIAFCDNYPDGDECGRMYFIKAELDPETVSHEATHMALGIIARHGHKSIVATTDIEPELSHDLCKLVGSMTGEILDQYTQSKLKAFAGEVEEALPEKLNPKMSETEEEYVGKEWYNQALDDVAEALKAIKEKWNI